MSYNYKELNEIQKVFHKFCIDMLNHQACTHAEAATTGCIDSDIVINNKIKATVYSSDTACDFDLYAKDDGRVTERNRGIKYEIFYKWSISYAGLEIFEYSLSLETKKYIRRTYLIQTIHDDTLKDLKKIRFENAQCV